MKNLINNYTPSPNGNAMSAAVFKQYCVPHRGDSEASVVVSSYRKDRLNERVINLLEEFSILSDNWDSDGAKAPFDIAIKNAKSLTSILSAQAQTVFNVAPGPNGELMLDIRNKDKSKSIEIIYYENKNVYVFFPAQGEPRQGAFNIDDLPNLLNELNQK